MTTPQPPDGGVPDDAAPPRPSLHDRLAEFEPEDDDLFDDEYDDEPAAAQDVTSYDDSAFAAVGDEPAAAEPADGPGEHDTQPVQPVTEPAAESSDEPAHEPTPETAVLDPFAAAPVPLAAVPVETPPEPTVHHVDEDAAEPDAAGDAEAAPSGTKTDAETDADTDALADAGPEAGVDAGPGAGVEAADAPPVAKTRRQRGEGRRLTLPVVALLIMTVLMAAATAYLWLQVREHDRTDAARRSGLEASRDAARLLFSYDYRTLDKDFATGRALTTGEFRTQYEKTTTKLVADVAKQYKAVVKANVVGAGVVRATPDTVVTVVYVNQVTTSTRVTGEKVDLSRVRMTLHRSGGTWLVTSVNAL